MHLLRTLLTLCVVLALVVPLRAGAADSYEIHVIIPMTGSGGFLGKSETTLFSAFETYANQHGGIAGRPIKFVLHDDTSNPQVAVQLTNELVAAKVPVIVGASLAATCSAEIPVLKNGPLAFCLSNAVVPPVRGVHVRRGGDDCQPCHRGAALLAAARVAQDRVHRLDRRRSSSSRHFASSG
jgi:hypothetical protein